MMHSVKARVKNGRLVLDEDTDLPEGTEVTLAVSEDEPDDEERARIIRAVEWSMDQMQAGKHTDANAVIARLLARE